MTFCCIALQGCVPTKTQHTPTTLTQQYIQTSPFKLASWYKITNANNDAVNIYIEGDGRARKTPHKASDDPTPRNAILLQMADLDPAANVVYLARPCQFSPDDLQTVCEEKYWNTARYSNTVVQAMNEAIDKIKQQTHIKKINLIGYSGGGTIAVLIAARRDDVASIRTIAGNLDLIAMQNYHGALPLTESLDPMTVAKDVRQIPQIHFVGKHDRIVPPKIAENFRKAADLKASQVVVIKDADHKRGWVERWQELLHAVIPASLH